MQAGGIREHELPQVLLGEEAVLHQLVGLFQHERHVGHVEVAHVGAEDRAEPVMAVAVEGPRGRHVVRLAAEVEALGEVAPQLLGRLERRRREVVDLLAVGALGQLLHRLERLDQAQAREQLVRLLLVGGAAEADEEVQPTVRAGGGHQRRRRGFQCGLVVGPTPYARQNASTTCSARF